MTRNLLFASAALLTLACDGAPTGPTASEARAVPAQSSPSAPDRNLATANAAPAPVIGSEYAATAASTDLFEIQSARLALQRSQNPAVRGLAGEILTDHRNSTAELRLAVTNLHSPVPVSAMLDPDQQAKLDALRDLRGAAFDPVFIRQQVDLHQKAMTLVTGYGERGDVPALKRHAQLMQDPIRNHLTRAQELAEALQ